jgi:hypothetical protein
MDHAVAILRAREPVWLPDLAEGLLEAGGSSVLAKAARRLRR